RPRVRSASARSASCRARRGSAGTDTGANRWTVGRGDGGPYRERVSMMGAEQRWAPARRLCPLRYHFRNGLQKAAKGLFLLFVSGAALSRQQKPKRLLGSEPPRSSAVSHARSRTGCIPRGLPAQGKGGGVWVVLVTLEVQQKRQCL